MTPTERAKRSDALYYETVSVTRRVLCDMIANREADLEDAKAESEHMRLKALAVMGELQEESERLKAENAKLRERIAELEELLPDSGRWFSADTVEAYVTENAKLRELVDYMTPIALYGASEQERDRMRELGVEVNDG